MNRSRLFAGHEYFEALKNYYPNSLKSDQSPVRFMLDLLPRLDQVSTDTNESRFVDIFERGFIFDQNAWSVSKQGDIRWMAANRTYKGLINLKTPFDLTLYSNLIWELQPKTIIEFGALQGGSSLWFADQLKSLSPEGSVHSFEIFDQAVHPRAQSNNLHFHHADLRNLNTLDINFLKSLPRPWLVIDDAHVNVENLLLFMGELLQTGDYFILEDYFIKSQWTTIQSLTRVSKIVSDLKLKVDTKYTDAFGYNMTSAPNAWFRRM